MDKTRVDIFMPTYKPNAKHLREAIDSIFAQTEQNWKLYIQDEPTDTDTKELVKKYLEDDRVSFQRNNERLGIGKNWNACLQHGNAPYIQYMFQDDIWKSHFLENGIRVLDEHKSVGMVSLEHEYNIEGETVNRSVYQNVDKVLSTIKEGEQEGISLLLWWMKHGLRNVIGEPCFVMLRRSIVNEVGAFHETMKQGLDAEYWTRVLAISNWYFLPGNFGSFRVHAEGASAQNTLNKTGMFDRLLNFYHALRFLPPRKKIQGWLFLCKSFLGMVRKFVTKKNK